MSDSAQKTQSDSKPFATGTVDFELQQENERLRSRIATLEKQVTELKKVLNKGDREGDIAASVRRPAAKSKHFTVDFKDAEFAKKERRNSVINGVDIGTRGGEFVVQSTTEHVSSDAAVVPIATKEEDSQSGSAAEEKATGKEGVKLLAEDKDADESGAKEQAALSVGEMGTAASRQTGATSALESSLSAFVSSFAGGEEESAPTTISEEDRAQQREAAKIFFALMVDTMGKHSLSFEEGMAELRGALSELGPYESCTFRIRSYSSMGEKKNTHKRRKRKAKLTETCRTPPSPRSSSPRAWKQFGQPFGTLSRSTCTPTFTTLQTARMRRSSLQQEFRLPISSRTCCWPQFSCTLGMPLDTTRLESSSSPSSCSVFYLISTTKIVGATCGACRGSEASETRTG